MARRKRPVEALPTIWNCPDDLWQLIRPILAEVDPPHRGHRQRIDPRKALDGIIFRLRSGIQWNRLPREFGDDASVHRTMQRWIGLGVLDRIWALLIEKCDELGEVDWQWQSIDCATGKARKGGIWSAQTPRIGPKAA
jgi:putative transposase